jgi:uncharacterized protein (TIGR00369 family)
MDLSSFETADGLNAISEGTLSELLGIRFTHVAHGLCRAELLLKPVHMAANGFLHAATVIALADTAAGYGCMASLPKGAMGFTTIELKTNFVKTARDGTVRVEACMRHGGRTTQVWGAEVETDDGQMMAAYLCTQMVLWPR